MKSIGKMMVLALFLSNQEVQGMKLTRADDKTPEEKEAVIHEKLKDTL